MDRTALRKTHGFGCLACSKIISASMFWHSECTPDMRGNHVTAGIIRL